MVNAAQPLLQEHAQIANPLWVGALMEPAHLLQSVLLVSVVTLQPHARTIKHHPATATPLVLVLHPTTFALPTCAVQVLAPLAQPTSGLVLVRLAITLLQLAQTADAVNPKDHALLVKFLLDRAL
jgi:hypothetical protein